MSGARQAVWGCLFIMVAALLGRYAYVCSCFESSKHCPLVVAFCDELGAIRAFRATDEQAVRFATTGPRWSGAQLLGYDASTRTWICEAQSSTWVHDAFSANATSSCVIAVSSGQSRVLRQVPRTTYLSNATFLNGNLYVPYVADGALVVQCYQLSGGMKSRHMYRVPGKQVSGEFDGSLAISSDGHIAADVHLDGSYNSYLCVFDTGGWLVWIHGNGNSNPAFDCNGQRIAFIGWSVDQSGKPSGSPRIYIYSLQNNTVRDLPSLLPSVIPPIVPGQMTSVCDIQWSTDGHRIVAAYGRVMSSELELYSLNVDSGTTKWCKVPLRLPSIRWCLLDKMPNTIRK